MASQTRKNRDKKARKMRRTLRNVFRKRSPESYLLRETKVGTPAARLRHYTIKIHIQTELTGKHVILFKRKLAVEPVQGVKFTATGLPKLPREPGAPYARPVVKGRNKAWDKLNKELGQTIIMVTHEDWHKKYAHRVIYLKDGLIEKGGK